ncbi:hypothetical protein PsalN5692_02459 [Piscirickettsia salmonis]|uniref:hypothetical protein n=1 Tax=Piscirickettsia salmonis TaxID=1238 RepID=UPI0012B896A7|nr:hypothetical protein [Piscirickettsia salmonis]QGP50986.1 hypothetical protein PsalN5692_02459 [Piscirickettsia salmonis]
MTLAKAFLLTLMVVICCLILVGINKIFQIIGNKLFGLSANNKYRREPEKVGKLRLVIIYAAIICGLWAAWSGGILADLLKVWVTSVVIILVLAFTLAISQRKRKNF